MPGIVPDDDLPDDLRVSGTVPIYDLPDELARPMLDEFELQRQARGPGEPRRGAIRSNLVAKTIQTSPTVQRTAQTMESVIGRRPDSMWDSPEMEMVGTRIAENLPSAIAGTKTGVKSVPAATAQMTSGVNMMLNAKAADRIRAMADESYQQSIKDGIPEAKARATRDRAYAWADREAQGVRDAAKKNLAASTEIQGLQNPKADRVEQAFAQGIPSAVQSMAVGIPAGVLSGGNPVVAGGAVAAVLGTGSAGARYAELVQAGVPDDQARRSAALLGTLEGLTEAIPGGTLVKGNKPMLKRALDFLLQDLVGENISTSAQMVDDYANGLSDSLTWDQWLEAVKQTTAATMVGGAAQVSAQAILEKSIEEARKLRKGKPKENLRARQTAPQPNAPENLAASTTEREFGPQAPTETDFPPSPPQEGAAQPETPPPGTGRAVPEDDLPDELRVSRETSQKPPAQPPGPEFSAGGVTFRDVGEGGFTATDDKTGAIVAMAQFDGDQLSEENADPDEAAQATLKSLREYAQARRAAPPEGAQKGTTTHQIAGQTVHVNTSPSKEQVAAGNYRKGKVKFQGLDVAIENPKGSERAFTTPNGRRAKRVMQDDYGYVRATEGADGDAIDVFIGPNSGANIVYVIDQLTPDGSKFDEHKVILGANSEQEARELYQRNYQKGWKGLGAITPITMERFKTWLAKGVQKDPIAWVPASAKRNARKVDPEHDSILEAIAKTKLHGAEGAGLSIEAMSAQGLDPADLRALRGMGITRPFSKKGAKSLDQMAERLFELGYPVTDADGNYSANKLLELIDQEIRGEQVFAVHKKHDSPEAKRAAQIESFMQTYQPPEELFDVPDAQLDHYIEMLQAIESERASDPEEGVMFSRGKPPQNMDLFGDAVAMKNELQRLMAEKDRRRNTGQESADLGIPGDLFSTQANRQTDITDKQPSISEQIDALNERVRRRIEARTGKPETGTPDILDMNEEERTELYRLKSQLPSPGEQSEAARERIAAKTAERKADQARAEKAALVKEFIGRSDAFWNIEEEDGDNGSEFRDSGHGGTQCTGYACQILKKLGKDRVAIKGYSEEENPGSAIVIEDGTGHDFAIVDGKFIVDPWLPEFSNVKTGGELFDGGVFDLERDKDEILRIYGPASKWKDSTDHWVAHMEKYAPKPGKTATGRDVKKTSTAKPVSATGLVDAGEKIGGARKDRWQDRGMNLSDLEGMSDTEAAKLVTKAAVWKPDYAAMIEAGTPLEVAAGVKVLWDKLAAKPSENTPAGRRHYLQGLGLLRTMLSEARTEQDLNLLEGKVSAALQVDWRQREADGYKTFWSIQKGRRSSLNWGWTEKQSAKKLIAAGFPNAEAWTRLFKLDGTGGRGTTDRGIELIMKDAEELGTPVTADQVREGLYRVRRKAGGTVGYAATKEGAEAVAKAVYEREKSGTDKDKPPERPHLDAIKRTGKQVRTRDAIPEDFLKDFGFRGIEFGNWAANDERQKLVNLAYDALHDLAAVLNIPPDALSLDGRLGLALGARGGGFGVAHYEPGKLVINMTKINGAGALAHEWGHALDHYFGELDRADAYTTDARGASGWYKMPRLSQNENLRPAMRTAFGNLMNAMFKRDRTKAMAVRQAELELEKHEGVLAGEESRLEKAQTAETPNGHFISRLQVWIAQYKPIVARARRNLEELRGKSEDDKTFGKTDTSYAINAERLSGKSTAAKLGYWRRPTEMFARAFESYVFDRLTDKNLESQYLVHGVEGDRYAEHPKGNPYPAGEERAAINAAFDTLFSTIQTRPGEKGVALFHTEKPLKAHEFGKKVEEELGLDTFDLYERNGDTITVNMLLVPRGSRKQGIGTQAMKLLTQYADERGMRIVLQTGLKDDVHGTTSSARLKKFYARFGFIENRGRRRDFSISENMVRNPVTVTKSTVKVREGGATYELNDRRKKDPAPGQLDIFTAKQEDKPNAQKSVDLAERVKLVTAGSFAAGITKVNELADAAHILAPLRRQAQENMLALVVDKEGKPLSVIRSAIGVVDGASVEVWSLSGAVASIPGAAEVYYAHNHPSGTLSPSSADEMITSKLTRVMEGTGIEVRGMFIFGPGQSKATFFGPRGGDFSVKIKPAARTSSVPLQERRYTKVGGGKVRSITDPSSAIQYVEDVLKNKPGIVLLNNRHSPIGFFPMTNEEMSKLRTYDASTGMGAVMRTLHEANSVAVILSGDHGPMSNLASMLREVDTRVLDAIYKDANGYSKSAMSGMGLDLTTFAHRARAAVVVPGAIHAAEVFGAKPEPSTDLAVNWSRVQIGNYANQKNQTAHIANRVFIPAADLAGLGETRSTPMPHSDVAIEEIADSMRANGYDHRFPILLTVDGNGKATIFDGNHRAKAAIKAGIEDIPVHVTYLNGGEDAGGEFSPENLGSVAMASAQREPMNGTSRAGAVRKAADKAMRQFADQPPVRVVDKFSDLPRAVYERIGGVQAMRSGVNAIMDFSAFGPSIYLIADRLRSPQHVNEVLMHEMTHYGIETVLSEQEWDEIAEGVLRDQKDRVRDIIKREARSLDMTNPKHKALVVHEVLAYMNQKRQTGQSFDQVEQRLWNRIVRAIRAFLAKIGLVGPVYTDDYIGELLDSMTAKMRSERVQAGKGDIPGFQIPLANQQAPVYYSAVLRAVKEMKTAKASADQWLATLRNRPGVKPEEMQWLGLEDWLKAQDGPVTKAQLEDFIASNQIIVTDVLKGGTGKQQGDTQRAIFDELNVELTSLGFEIERDMDGELGSLIRIRDGARFDYVDGQFLDDEEEVVDEDIVPARVGEILPEMANALENLTEEKPEADETRYKTQTLPGGGNYRELLLTLPVEKKQVVGSRASYFGESTGADYEGWDVVLTLEDGSVFRSEVALEDAPTESDAIRIAIHTGEGHELTDKSGYYSSSHWDERNVLAHVRLTDRTDSEGKKVLFVEEIQSDWHQAGRKRGYRQKIVAPEKATRLPDGYSFDRQHGHLYLNGPEGYSVMTEAMPDRASIDEAMEKALILYNRYLEREIGRQNERKPPDAPFKTSWPELSFKRILRMAAEEGYDRIAWTTGDQQNKRYKLEDRISKVELRDNASSGISEADMEGPFESGILKVYSKDGRSLMELRKTESEIREYIGDELTDKLLAVKPTQERHAGLGVRMRRLQGLDLKVGGSGMRGFYDDMLPAMINRLTKKWGGKVGSVRLQKTDGIEMPSKSEITELLIGYVEGNTDAAELSEELGVEVTEADLESVPMDPNRAREQRQFFSSLADRLIQRGKGQAGSKQPSIDITPAMKKAALEGLPLFHRENMRELRDKVVKGSVSLDETSKLSRAWNWFVFRAQDKFNDLLRLQKAASDDKAVLPENLDAYMRETLYHGRTEYRIEQYDKDFVQPLVKLIKASGYTFDQVEEFLYARHAPEANAHIRKITETDIDLFGEREDEWHSGMTDKDAAAVMAELAAAGDMRKLDAIGQHVDRMTKFERDIMVSEGLVSAAEVGAWEARYQHYVPLKGWEDRPDAGRLPGRGKGYDTGGRLVKARTGRKTLADNLLANIVGQTQATITKAEKAKVGRAFLEFAKTHPSELYEVNQVEMERYYDPRSGTVRERPVFRGLSRGDNLLNVKVDGKDQWIEFNEDDPQAMRLASAFKNLSAKEMNGFFTFMLGVNRYLSTVNTSLNPEFVISNMFRDLQTALINMNATEAKELKARVLADWRKAFGGIMSGEFGKGQTEWAQHFEDFKRFGAKTGWVDFTTSPVDLENKLRSQLDDKGALNVAKHGLSVAKETIEKVNLAVENAIRLSVFVNARREGMSADKAAELAKNLTVNFNRKGDWGTELNAVYLFYNAAAQGTAVLWNAMKNKSARRVMYGMVGMAIAMQIINRIVGGEDDDGENRYDKIPESERAKNIIIMLPKSWRWKLESGDEVDHLKIPLPYGYNMVYYTGAAIGDVLDYNFFGYKHRLDVGGKAASWASEFLEAYNPIGSSGSIVQTISPTVLDPAIALYENKNWYGGRIYPDAPPFQVKPPDSELYYRNASDLSKLVAQTSNEMFGGSTVTPNKWGMDFSPNSIDYLFDFAAGGIGRFLENSGRTSINLFASREDIDIGQVPFARRVLGQTGDRYIADTYYERMQQIEYLEGERDLMRNLEKGTPERAKKEAYIASNYATAEALYEAAKAADGRIGRLRKEKNALKENRGQSEEAPRKQRLLEIDQEIQDEMQRFNSRWNAVEDAKRSPVDTRGLIGDLGSLVKDKTKPEVVRALRESGKPAMATLVNLMPFRARPEMAEKYRAEIAT